VSGKRWFQLIRTYAGLVVLLGAMTFAAVRVIYNHITYEAPDVTTIRLCHWQLEAGFREALQQLIDEYETVYHERTGKRVRILQIPVSERGYQQFVNTGLIGGTAPDIIEKGKAKTAIDPSYVARFYLPLSEYVAEPNPYNAGTPLEGLPWSETFVDEMSSCYDYGLGDYYYIPFSMFTMRIYYNKDLFRRATGRSDPPDGYAAFLDACRQIRDYGQQQGRPLAPIAGSRFQIWMFQINFERAFHYVMIDGADDNADSNADYFETYRAYLQDRWDFHAPPLQAGWACMAEIARNFQHGWLAAQRDDAVFMFAQERAAMYASGSWDASSIVRQVGENFEVGVMDFPLPTDHPVYGKYVLGPRSEANSRGGIPWAINARTKHARLCIDFLKFCTTRAHNERFNKTITWIPVVRGTRLSERLRPFKPRIKGFYGSFNYNVSAAVRVIGEGSRWTVYTGGITPDEYARRLTDVYERTAREGYLDALDKMRRRGRDLQRILASLQTQTLHATSTQRATLADKALHVLHSVQSVTGAVTYHRRRLAEIEGELDRPAGTDGPRPAEQREGAP
jgi:raffinose/stachyose/melibiose transport system substrate-binding protein